MANNSSSINIGSGFGNYTFGTSATFSSPVTQLDDLAIQDALTVKGKLVLNGVDVSEFIETLQRRLLILQPNFEAHEKYPALKDAYEQYLMLEKLLMESNSGPNQD